MGPVRAGKRGQGSTFALRLRDEGVDRFPSLLLTDLLLAR
jgi:hypothetical protein